MKNKIILIGYFSETIELCEKANYEITGIVDVQEPVDSKYKYLGNDDNFLKNYKDYLSIPLFLVPDQPIVREALYNRYKNKGFRFEAIISPNAIVSKSAQIGEGSMIQDGCNISANVKIGRFVRVNSLANVMHDSEIGDFSTLAPSCVVLGRCDVEKKSYIGANATILPERTVHEGAIIGAGAVVTKDVGKGLTFIGVPASEIMKDKQ